MWDSLTPPPHAHHYWVWCVDINDGWPDCGNLIVGGPVDLEPGSDHLRICGWT